VNEEMTKARHDALPFEPLWYFLCRKFGEELPRMMVTSPISGRSSDECQVRANPVLTLRSTMQSMNKLSYNLGLNTPKIDEREAGGR
jgi:hypothetical protein